MDEDWHNIALDEGDQLTVNLTFVDEEGDIDVRIINADGNTVVFGTSTSDNEEVSFLVDGANTDNGAGTYWVRVYLYADAGSEAGNPYSMDVAVGTP